MPARSRPKATFSAIIRIRALTVASRGSSASTRATKVWSRCSTPYVDFRDLPQTISSSKIAATIKAGYFADLAIFDPAKVQDHSVPGDPHRYSEGMARVFVNGVQVLRDGEHTGCMPGRVVRGPGWRG